MLQGMKIPVMLSLILGQRKWDYLDYIRVQANLNGKNVKSAGQFSANLMQLLTGVSPKGAVPLTVSDSSVQAWKYGGQYLLLTKATLLSPGWLEKQVGSGPSPLHAYTIAPTPYLMLNGINGQLERVTITQTETGSDSDV